MNADRGDTPEDEGEEEDDDDDDGMDNDMLLAAQPPDLPPLLSRVYVIESPDHDIPDISSDRGDLNSCILDHNDERPSQT